METNYPQNLLEKIFMSSANIRSDYDLEFALSKLDDRKRKIIYLRFKEGKTLPEVGKEFGITCERVRQLEQVSLRRLRHPDNFNHEIKVEFNAYDFDPFSTNEKQRQYKRIRSFKNKEEALIFIKDTYNLEQDKEDPNKFVGFDDDNYWVEAFILN